MHLLILSSSIPVPLCHIEYIPSIIHKLFKAANHPIIRNIHVSNQLCQSSSG